jgi:hypothetical protein
MSFAKQVLRRATARRQGHDILQIGFRVAQIGKGNQKRVFLEDLNRALPRCAPTLSRREQAVCVFS